MLLKIRMHFLKICLAPPDILKPKFQKNICFWRRYLQNSHFLPGQKKSIFNFKNFQKIFSKIFEIHVANEKNQK